MEFIYKTVKLSAGENAEILEKIYKLRLVCWQKRDKQIAERFPSGWKDKLDISAIHYAIFDNQDNIIAAARVNILPSVNELSLSKYFNNTKYQIFTKIGLISRNVVHPQHQNMGLAKVLDKLRLQYLTNEGVDYCFCSGERTKVLSNYGFEKICQLPIHAPENIDKNSDVWIMVKEFDSIS